MVLMVTNHPPSGVSAKSLANGQEIDVIRLSWHQMKPPPATAKITGPSRHHHRCAMVVLGSPLVTVKTPTTLSAMIFITIIFAHRGHSHADTQFGSLWRLETILTVKIHYINMESFEQGLEWMGICCTR
uniref:Uncharacterized protein n=1 Tax=Odontella aurita TaxID=265563 RepID=A0A7S4NIV7_9STRA